MYEQERTLVALNRIADALEKLAEALDAYFPPPDPEPPKLGDVLYLDRNGK